MYPALLLNEHIRLRFTEFLSILLSTLQPEIWLESNFKRKSFSWRTRRMVFMQMHLFLHFSHILHRKHFQLFIFDCFLVILRKMIEKKVQWHR